MKELLRRINSLKNIPRMGWLESGISPSEAEDVAQHSFETASITLLLSDKLDEDEEIDTERALRMAVVHDWAESVTGDFSKEASEAMGPGVKVEIEEGVFENVLMKEYSETEPYLELLREYNHGETIESKLVRVADLLSILVEARKLFAKGESSEKLEEIWSNVKKELKKLEEDFPFLRDLLAELDRK